jgi:hypothetical protein
MTFKKGDTHFMYSRVQELAKKTGLKACTLLDEDGNPIQTIWKEHFGGKLKSSILPDPAVLNSHPIIATDPRPP